MELIENFIRKNCVQLLLGLRLLTHNYILVSVRQIALSFHLALCSSEYVTLN